MPNIPSHVVPIVRDASNEPGLTFPFWYSTDIDDIEKGMWQLALGLETENPKKFFAGLPPGYAIVYWIFEWERNRAMGGFVTGLENAGTVRVHEAANSYEVVGMKEEAEALRAMLEQSDLTPKDFQKVEKAYNLVPNPYKQDWDRFPHLVNTLRTNALGYFYEA